MADERPRVVGLKRSLGVWGSFSMGYADVGDDYYIALGVVALYAAALSPIALALAAITYICTALCYAELASAHPVAGGAQVFSQRAFGDLHGFIAGWGLMLDYTVCTAFFALAAVGYLSILVNRFFGIGFLSKNPYYAGTAILIILGLMCLNILGIRESSRFNEIFVATDLITVACVMLVGFLTVFSFQNWFSQIKWGENPTLIGFLHGYSLAVCSYIGIESISQAAEETRRPARVIPKATGIAIIAIVSVAVGMSTLAMGVINYRELILHSQAPVSRVAEALPGIGSILATWTAFTGFMLCTVSTNTGVIGVSRVTYSMGRLQLMPDQFRKVHSKFRTPYVTIIIFSLVACGLLLVAMATPGLRPGALETGGVEEVGLLAAIADLYNFGALIAYMYVNLSTIVLRIKEPYVYRPWKIPGNIKITRNGHTYELPVIPMIGFTSCLVIWLLIVWLHRYARILGPIWFAIGFAMYALYRRRKGLPILPPTPKIFPEESG